MTAGPTVVIGIGNPFRRDDGAGIRTVRLAAGRLPGDVEIVELDGEATRLLDAWSGARLAVVVDATRSGATPGTVRRIDADREAIPASTAAAGSTHGTGLADAVALGQAVGRLPGRLVVFGIEGADFDDGEGLDPRVEAAAASVATRIHEEVTG